MTRRALALLAVVLLVAGLLCASATGAQRATTGSAGIGDPYFPRDGNGGYDVLHYDIRDTVVPSTGLLSGTTTIRARATQGLTGLLVDLLLEPVAVSVDGRRAAFEKVGAHELRIVPSRPIAVGEEFRVRVAHRGRPGAIRYGGERPWFGNAAEVLAVNEPHIAPWWFAANDHPSDKARFDITITVPRGLQVVSNGSLVERRDGRRRTAYHWRSVEPMTTYLAFFAAGRFAIERGTTPSGVPYTLAVSRQLRAIEQQLAWQLMRRTPVVQTWLERRLGPYPFRSSGGLTTSHTTGFALENQTRSVYPFVGGSGADDLVAHELAHQWFGDSVSLERWSDIWLNEGLATYMGVWWSLRGSADHPRALRAWLLRSYDDMAPEEWDLAIGDPGPARLFRGEVYVRGAMTVQALRRVVGEDDFGTLLRRWVVEHRHGNATTADFEALAEQVSGQELGPFFDVWLESGRPARTAANGLD